MARESGHYNPGSARRPKKTHQTIKHGLLPELYPTQIELRARLLPLQAAAMLLAMLETSILCTHAGAKPRLAPPIQWESLSTVPALSHGWQILGHADFCGVMGQANEHEEGSDLRMQGLGIVIGLDLNRGVGSLRLHLRGGCITTCRCVHRWVRGNSEVQREGTTGNSCTISRYPRHSCQP